MRRFFFLLVCFAFAPAQADVDRSIYTRLGQMVVKVRAHTSGGVVPFGSAVVVAPGKVVTNCHVTREARAIDVIGLGGEWRVKKQVRDVGRDLCLLDIGIERGTPVELAPAAELRVGHQVVAAGFPGGTRLSFSEGTVRALHPYQDGHVIQSDAEFSVGESGGALFDASGRLVGILTFHSYAKGAFFFALPATWIQRLLDAEPGQNLSTSSVAFWERSYGDQPFFMRAGTHEALEDWSGLDRLAGAWSEAEPNNPEAWLALGKAQFHTHRSEEAIASMRRAVKLDPRHAEGWYYLGTVYRDTREERGLEEARSILQSLNPRAARQLEGAAPVRD
jgi:serine protease Do